jgi:hypothetical protein
VKKLAPTLALILLASLPLAAQDGSKSGVDAAGPGEPQIVMPQVILQVEDLSVEKVVAQLPPEEDLLPPARPVPVLSEGELEVGDPVIPATGEPSDVTVTPARDRFLSSDVSIGAGMQNRIIGSVSLKTLGADPRFSLRFNHETVDGLGGQAAGAGFSTRNDLLDGSLKFGLGPIDTSLGGTYTEGENGLQERSAYSARLARSISGSADFAAAPLSWLSLDAGASASTDTLILEGAAPYQRSNVRVTPTFSAQVRFGAVTVGLTSLYTFRTDTGISSPGLHRFSVSSSISASLPGTFILAGDFGWFWNSDGLSLFPFSVSLAGTPWEFITISLGGGYRVQTYDLHDVLASHPLAFPDGLADDHGWFGNASVQLTITRELSATIGLAFMSSASLPTGSSVQDSGTGLFVVTQVPGVRLSMDGGLRWGISSAFSLAASLHHEFLSVPFFTPVNSLAAEIVGLAPSGRFGGSLSATAATTPDGVLQQPVLRLSGFWNVSDSVKLQLDAEDLLWLLLPAPRIDIAPYLAPGFRVTGSIGMSL